MSLPISCIEDGDASMLHRGVSAAPPVPGPLPRAAGVDHQGGVLRGPAQQVVKILVEKNSCVMFNI